jgi:hypothetical protein
VVLPHVVPHAPQFVGVERSTSHPSVGSWLQSAKPVRHANPHVPLVHVADACVGTEHGVHDVVPHEATPVSLTHAPLHRW